MLTLDQPAPDLWGRFESGSLTARDIHTHPVLVRWERARALRALGEGSTMPPSSDAIALHERHDLATKLVARAAELLQSACADLRRQGFAVLLADHDGVVLFSRGNELFRDLDVRGGLVDGISARRSSRADETRARSVRLL